MSIDMMPDETVWRPRENVDGTERVVLGSLLLLEQVTSEDAVTRAKIRVAEILQACPPDRYWQPRHQVIAAAIAELAGRGVLPDPVAVAGELERGNALARLPHGQMYL